MTDEEKEGLRRLKEDVSRRLQESAVMLCSVHQAALFGTDKRIGDYVTEVIWNPEKHNLYEILGVNRFFYLLGKYEWRPGKVRHFFKFYEALRFSGVDHRRRYKRSSSETSSDSTTPRG